MAVAEGLVIVVSPFYGFGRISVFICDQGGRIAETVPYGRLIRVISRIRLSSLIDMNRPVPVPVNHIPVIKPLIQGKPRAFQRFPVS